MKWMQTYSGTPWYFERPRPGDVSIFDIAHALSQLCRYGGHTSRFYSVAEHSYHVSHIVSPQHALAGLMHDATEAYVCDVPRPLKGLLSNYKDLEHRAWLAVAEKFKLDVELPKEVHDADNAILFCEREQLMSPMSDPELAAAWGMGAVRDPSLQVAIQGWGPTTAETVFLGRFKELTSA